MLTYPTDLICLAFVVNGGRCQHNWRISTVWHPQIFFILVCIFTYFENLVGLKKVQVAGFDFVKASCCKITLKRAACQLLQ